MKKKILFFITSLAGGGAEKVLVNMVNNLDKNKYDITVQCLFDYGVNKKNLKNDITYRYVFKKIIRGNTQLFKLFSPKFLYKHMIKEEYDIVVSYFQSPTTRIIAGCPDNESKLVQWIHNEFHDDREIICSYRSKNECVYLQKKYDATVYVANTVKEIYLKTFPEIKKHDIVLYNVVQSDLIKKMAEESVDKGLFGDELTLISVGRMVEQKSFDRLLKVCAMLRDDGLKFQLLLLGSGKLEQKHKKLATKLNLNNLVKFLGYNDNPYKYVKKADLFVCSSLHEGFSTAITESLIVGTPVITTMCSGMKELLGENEYGIITENDEIALYRGVKKLLEDRKLLEYYTRKAKERGSKFSTEATVREIDQFFMDL